MKLELFLRRIFLFSGLISGMKFSKDATVEMRQSLAKEFPFLFLRVSIGMVKGRESSTRIS